MNQNIKNKKILNNISSNYCLRGLFSYLKYNDLLKFIKTNKELQKKLGINVDNFKSETNFDYFRRKSTIIKNEAGVEYEDENSKSFFMATTICLTCPCAIFFLIIAILFASKSLFNENNLKENYDENAYDTIKIINGFLFLYIIIFIGTLFLLNCYIYRNMSKDTNMKIYFKFGLLILIEIINIIYECLVIWKLALSYKIKKGGTTWFMVLDYLFIVFNFLYIGFMAFIFYLYYDALRKRVFEDTNYALEKYKNVKINFFLLPKNFYTLDRKRKMEIITNNEGNYQLYYSQEEIDLIFLINRLREKNNLPIFRLNVDKKIPEFIINPTSELIVNTYNNFVKLNENKYLFRYQIGEFENKLRNKEEVITNILLKEDLNSIIVIRQGIIQYIEIYESFDLFDNEIQISKRDNLNSKILENFNLFRSLTDIQNEDTPFNIM